MPETKYKAISKCKSKPQLSARPIPTKIRRHEVQKIQKLFQFRQKKVLSGIELLGYVFSSMGVTTVVNAQKTR